jgi:hypothetical protein
MVPARNGTRQCTGKKSHDLAGGDHDAKTATRKRVAGLGMATKKEDERPKCGIVSDHSEQL